MFTKIVLLAPTLLVLSVLGCQPALPAAPTISPASATRTASPSPTLSPSPTPTLMGTWPVTLDGLVYDASIGPERPIAGAAVTYNRFSYLALPPSGRTVTADDGKYTLTLLVHDTDSLTFSVAAPGFLPFTEKQNGVWFYGGARRIDVGLIPEITPSSEAPSTPTQLC